MKQDYAFEALENKRIKVSIIDELNDPFEFLPRFINSSQETLFSKWKDKISKERGIVCFSKEWSNPLLWSHYAEKHEGFALGLTNNRDSDYFLASDFFLPRQYRTVRSGGRVSFAPAL